MSIDLLLFRHFQRYLAQSKWRLCEHFQKGGNWRHLIVRSNSLNELMMIVVIHPQNLETEEIHEEMLRMKDYMLNCSIDNLRSMYYQSWYAGDYRFIIYHILFLK